MKKIIPGIVLTMFALVGYSQNATDALRYSFVSYEGTARFSGLSGAYGAIGADFSSLSQNPAGIALYRKSEFTITPGFFSSSSKSSFFNESSKDYRTNLSLRNVGMVFAQVKNEENPNKLLKGLQFGFGLNQLANFNNRIVIEGFNTENSLLGEYAGNANNGGNPINLDALDPFSALQAYNTNLLVFDSADAYYWVDMPDSVLQRKTIQTLGTSREMLLSCGANFGNKLYLGISFAFPSLRYEEESNFSEQDSKGLSSNADPSYNFDAVKRSEYLLTRGGGFNMKFGFIYKPLEFLRIGGAFHTPTTYNLTDEWNSSMVSYFENGSRYSDNSPDGTYDYRITTPMRAIGSLALVSKYGLISADYEYIDYSTARLRADGDDFFDVNEIVRNELGQAHNIRIGAEVKLNIITLRAGTSYYGSPYQDSSTRGARMGYSAGLGIREKGYFMDFAFNHVESKDDLYLYGSTFSANTYKTNRFMMTLGLRF